MLTVHGRIKEHIKQRIGPCDFEIIKNIKQKMKIPVYANGGVCDLHEAYRCIAYTKVQCRTEGKRLPCKRGKTELQTKNMCTCVCVDACMYVRMQRWMCV